jgi:hypothetical protein
VPWVSCQLSENWKFTLGVSHYTSQRFYELLPQVGDSEPSPPFCRSQLSLRVGRGITG